MDKDQFPHAKEMYDETKISLLVIEKEETEKYLDKIHSLILDSSTEGNFSTTTDMVLSSSIINILKEKGYEVSGDNGAYCEDASWIISWKNPNKRQKIDT